MSERPIIGLREALDPRRWTIRCDTAGDLNPDGSTVTMEDAGRLERSHKGNPLTRSHQVSIDPVFQGK